MNKETWPTLNANVRWQSGVLVDADIRRAIENNQLVHDGDLARAKYATYELVIGRRVEELVMDDPGDPQQDLYRVKSIPDDGVFSVLPGQTFKVFAKESLYMPSDITAIAIPVGIMYKLGLNPETTFADPGFAGPFFVTICNYSPRIVKLRIGDPLARMFFLKVRDRPEKIHEGTPRDIPPAVERVPRPTDEQLGAATEAAILSDVLKVVDPPHYQHAFITNKIVSIHRTQLDTQMSLLQSEMRLMRRVIVGLGVLVFGALSVFGYRLFAGSWPSLTEGALASLLAAGLWMGGMWGIGKLKGWMR